MSNFLQVPLKKSTQVDFVKPLSKYIDNTFSGEVLNENKDSLAELNQLRGNAVVKSLDRHESSLEVVQRYYDQLMTMEAKLPIAEDQIRLSFTWYDAFDKGSIFGSTKCSLSSGAYERFCVLFNIGGLLSQLAYNQNHTTDDGLKTAAKYYQQAAGIFSYLKDNVYPVLQTLPTPDLSVSCLTALSAIMLAHAQDCFFIKASSDKMKDAIVAKVAAQASDFYQEAVRSASNHEVKGLWEKDWIPILQLKQNYFLAVAEYHQALVSESSGKYGEAVARLQKADKQISDAAKAAGQIQLSELGTMKANISKKLATTKKDNELIYLEAVPSIDQLPAVGRAALSKALPFSSPMSSNFVDLFTKLVPMAVHQAISAYEAQKSNIVNSEIVKLREATQFLNGVLASLNLPAAIEDLSGSSVPPSVLEKAAELKKKGGLAAIDSMMQNLPDMLMRNQELLDETFRLLDEEANEDGQMRNHFKERWSRTPSSKLTQQLRDEGEKYKNILSNATSADGIVKEKYNTHRRGMEILSKSDSDIAASLPQGDSHISGAASEHVKTLQGLMQQVKQTQSDRQKLEEELKSATVDMQSKFLQALAAEGFLDGERIANANIDELYGPLRTQVAEIVEGQSELIEQIQNANKQFESAKQGHVSERDQILKDLAAAYDAYIELSGNLQEGTKFYSDLTNIMLKFQSKVNDFVFARKTEKDDLSKDLQQRAAKGTAAPTPSVPSHHQNAPRQPPQRPPPPQQQQQPPAPQQTQQPPPPQQTQQPYHPVPAPRPRPGQNPPPAAAAAAPPSPSMPYPAAPNFMPQPGYYAPPGGAAPYGYAAPNPYTGFPPQQPYAPQPYGGYGQQPPPGQYMPPYGQQQQQPMGYQGYPQYPPQ